MADSRNNHRSATCTARTLGEQRGVMSLCYAMPRYDGARWRKRPRPQRRIHSNAHAWRTDSKCLHEYQLHDHHRPQHHIGAGHEDHAQ
eukprot:799445-Pyramimonas_sp.AAC.1